MLVVSSFKRSQGDLAQAHLRLHLMLNGYRYSSSVVDRFEKKIRNENIKNLNWYGHFFFGGGRLKILRFVFNRLIVSKYKMYHFKTNNDFLTYCW